MAKSIQSNRRDHSKAGNRKSRKRRGRRHQPHRPNGGLGARVKRVGGEKFALVCVDPAKRRSEWWMADYFGNILIEPRTMEHEAKHFQLAVLLARRAQEQHGIEDLIVVVERTGNYHRPPQRAFARAGFETRIVHPFATKQFRVPAAGGIKTDANDLAAMHRAAVAGFGLCEEQLDERHGRLRLRVRHRRDLVQKSSALACQVREHWHQALPGYAELFSNFFSHRAARAIARRCASPAAVRQRGASGLEAELRAEGIRFQKRTIDKILCWAREAPAGDAEPHAAMDACAASHPSGDAALHHALGVELDELHATLRRRVAVAERDVAGDLAGTPYVRLLRIPGIHVVSAADFAGEMGPIFNYANANAITGRAGLYPSRYQSDQTDHADGPLVRMANRKLRGALLRIADNLVKYNRYYRGQAERDRARRIDEREIRVKVAKRFSRLAFAGVAGDQPLRHPCCQMPDSVLEKLRSFHHEHRTPADVALRDLQAAAEQLLPQTRIHEAQVVSEILQRQTRRRRGPSGLGELLPAVLARLGGAALDGCAAPHASSGAASKQLEPTGTGP